MEQNVKDTARYDVARSNQIWEAYVNILMHCGHVRYSEEFSRTKLHFGVLESGLNDKLRIAIEESPVQVFSKEDGTDGALMTSFPDAVVDKLNTQHRYCSDSEMLRAVLREVLEALAIPVSQAFGGPWRILNIRAWSTPIETPYADERAKEHGATEWHRDGMPLGLFKIMLYPTAIGPDLGGLELRMDNGEAITLSGPAGSWVLFFNSHLDHRGTFPTKPGVVRRAVELTISPWHCMAIEPVFLGLNARHPIYPL